MKRKDIRCLRRVMILLFALSVTVPMLPCSYINTYGLFGEVKTAAVTKEADREMALISSQISVLKKQKGVNVWNIYFVLWIMIICICLLACVYKMPREDTIADRKVRMDN